MNKLFLTIILLGCSVTLLTAQSLDSAEVVIGTTAFALAKAKAAETEPNPDSLVYWKKGGRFNVNLQQVGLTNWAAGGESSFAVGAAVVRMVVVASSKRHCKAKKSHKMM